MKGRGGEVVGNVKKVRIGQHCESNLIMGSPGWKKREQYFVSDSQTLKGWASPVQMLHFSEKGDFELAMCHDQGHRWWRVGDAHLVMCLGLGRVCNCRELWFGDDMSCWMVREWNHPCIHQLMMSLFKAKTGNCVHVNFSGIINWTPVLHNKAALLAHPPP